MKRLFRIVLYLTGAGIIAFGLLIANAFYRFDLWSNEIVQSVWNNPDGRWGARLSLVPDPLPSGLSSSALSDRLADAGFKRMEEKDADRFGYEDEHRNGTIIYFREANKFPCDAYVFVLATLAPDGKAMSVEGTTGLAGCL
jgi:hypothetical protein